MLQVSECAHCEHISFKLFEVLEQTLVMFEKISSCCKLFNLHEIKKSFE